MHALALAALLFAAAPAQAPAAAAEEAALEEVPEPVAATQSSRGAEGASVALPLLGASAVALGAAAGVLLSLPLGVPILYLAALASLPAAVGALPLLLVVPLAAALGSGGVAAAFSGGLGPWLVGTLSGAAAGAALLAVGVVVASAEPRTPLDLHLGVLSLVGVPSLAAAATAAVTLPFFLTGTSAAFE